MTRFLTSTDVWIVCVAVATCVVIAAGIVYTILWVVIPQPNRRHRR